MEHLDHFARIGELQVLLPGLVLREVLLFSFVCLDETYPALENLAWELVMELVGVFWDSDRRPQLLRLYKMMPAHRSWVVNINQIVLIHVFHS